MFQSPRAAIGSPCRPEHKDIVVIRYIAEKPRLNVHDEELSFVVRLDLSPQPLGSDLTAMPPADDVMASTDVGTSV